ncbi:MAG: hypothetical protein ABIH29_01415 [Candidatus Micrarchaeota archaeon]
MSSKLQKSRNLSTEIRNPNRKFGTRTTLKESILLSAASIAATVIFTLSPAYAQSAKCSARVVPGEIGERFSLKTSGTKVEGLTLRFSIPVKGSHGELAISGPFADSLVTMPEDVRFTVLSSNLTKGRTLLSSSRRATFGCISGDSEAPSPVPIESIQKLVREAGSRMKQLDATRKLTGVSSKTKGDVSTFISKRGPLMSAIKGRDIPGLQRAIEQADSHLLTMRSEVDASAQAIKSEALDLSRQLREAASELPEGRQKRAAIQLADSVEAEAGRDQVRVSALTKGMASIGRAIPQARDAADAARERQATADAAEKAQADAAEKVRVEARTEAAKVHGMDRCTGDFPVSIITGKGAVERYKLAVPLKLVVESGGTATKDGTDHPIRAVLEVSAKSILPQHVKGTIESATKTIRRSLDTRCPAGNPASIEVIETNLGVAIMGLRNKMISKIDGITADEDGNPERPLLLKVRGLLAGRSKAEEDAAISAAKQKAGVR